MYRASHTHLGSRSLKIYRGVARRAPEVVGGSCTPAVCSTPQPFHGDAQHADAKRQLLLQQHFVTNSTIIVRPPTTAE